MYEILISISSTGIMIIILYLYLHIFIILFLSDDVKQSKFEVIIKTMESINSDSDQASPYPETKHPD